MGQLPPEGLRSIVDQPSVCRFWVDDSHEQRQGVLLHDPFQGPTIVFTDSLDPSVRGYPHVAALDKVHGQTAGGVRFSIHDATVHSYSPNESFCIGEFGFIGDWIAVEEPRFNNLTIWNDWLLELLVGKDWLPPDTSFDPVEVGAVTVHPIVVRHRDRVNTTATEIRLNLECRQHHSVLWWLDQWVNPLQRLALLCTGGPSKTTLLGSKVNRREHGDHEHHDWVYIAGRGWPTMNLAALKPLARADREQPDPLLKWTDSHFDLANLMTNVRREARRLDVPFENYVDLTYTELRPRHQFLLLVQALESLHTTLSGKLHPERHQDLESLMVRLKDKTVNRPDRDRIRRGLREEKPGYTLAERLGALVASTGLPDPPELELTWIEDENERKSVQGWQQAIAKARNDISHGTAVPPPWLLEPQNHYLQMVLEYHLLRSLGLSVSHCHAMIRYRYDRNDDLAK